MQQVNKAWEAIQPVSPEAGVSPYTIRVALAGISGILFLLAGIATIIYDAIAMGAIPLAGDDGFSRVSSSFWASSVFPVIPRNSGQCPLHEDKALPGSRRGTGGASGLELRQDLVEDHLLDLGRVGGRLLGGYRDFLGGNGAHFRSVYCIGNWGHHPVVLRHGWE